MKYALIILFLLSITAQAAQVKIVNADDWKVTFIPKGTQASAMLGGADFSLTSPVHRGGVIPTVLVGKFPVSETPRGVLQWREMALKDREDFKPLPGERVLTSRGVKRYIATFERNIAKDSTTKVMMMAMIVDGEMYLFSYQGSLQIFQANEEEIFKLYRTVSLVNE